MNDISHQFLVSGLFRGTRATKFIKYLEGGEMEEFPGATLWPGFPEILLPLSPWLSGVKPLCRGKIEFPAQKFPEQQV
jgi:hypothetical protein